MDWLEHGECHGRHGACDKLWAVGGTWRVTSRWAVLNEWMHGSYCGVRGVASYGGMQDVAAMAACWGRVPNSRWWLMPATQQQTREVGSCAIIHTCNLHHGVVCRLGGV